MKKVLLTGGNGLLGANTARELFRRGYEVRLILRKNADRKGVENLPVEIFEGDITKEEDLRQVMKGIDVVIHTASQTSQYPNNLSHYEEINIKCTQLLAKLCRKMNIEKFIYVSTANTFGYGSMDEPGDELNEFRLYKYGSGYINSKYLAQKFLLEESERGLPVVIVNPTFMIGAFDSKPSSGEMIVKGVNSILQICPPGGKNFVHVRDVARGICNAITKGKIGECYLLAGENMSYKSFYDIINKETGINKPKITIPKFVLITIGYIIDFINKFFKTSIPLSSTNAKLLCIGNYYTPEKAISEIDFLVTPVNIAVRDAVEWFKEKNMI